MAAAAQRVVGVHGRVDGRDCRTTWIGGRSAELVNALVEKLAQARFTAVVRVGSLTGVEPAIICNRVSSGAGIQLELPRNLLEDLVSDPVMTTDYANAIRQSNIATNLI